MAPAKCGEPVCFRAMELLARKRYAVTSYGVAAAYAGWLLKHYGADVEHVSALDPEGLGAFLAEGGQFEPEPRVQAPPPDVTWITDAPLTPATRAVIEIEAKRRRVVWITPWGIDTPWAGRPASDFLLHAAGGWLHAVGDPAGEPLGPPGAQAQFITGQFATIAALGDLAEPGLIDVSILEATAATLIYDSVSFQYSGNVRTRAGNRYSRGHPLIATLACKDGWIGLHGPNHRQWLRLCALMGQPDLLTDPRFANPMDRARNVAALDEYLLPWLARRTRWEVYHELQRAGIPASAHPTMEEVLTSPQLGGRDWWHPVTIPSGRVYRVPGPPARVEAESVVAPAAQGREMGPWRPGRLRVVDLSMGWAGPMVSHVLSAYGADVIKVESHTHFDWWRGGRPPGDRPELALHERSAVFNTVNRGKRGITLDLTTSRGNELAKQLIASADVVVENFSAGVIAKLGLTYETLSAENPRLVMLRQPAWGLTGPEASYFAFGNTIEGMSGLSGLMGYAGREPTMMSNALGDPVSGLHGVIAVMAALSARERDGRGRCIEAAQLEGFLPLVSEALLEYQRTGQQPARRGNERDGAAPCGAFPCAGDDDEWVAIEVRSDHEWARLASLIGEPWALASGYQSYDGRRWAAEALRDQLSAWTAPQDRDELVVRLLAAKMLAAPVHSEADILTVDQFTGTEFFTAEERAHVGLHLYPGLPLRARGGRIGVAGPAPTLGEDNFDVLTGMGLTEAEVAELEAESVIGTRPV